MLVVLLGAALAVSGCTDDPAPTVADQADAAGDAAQGAADAADDAAGDAADAALGGAGSIDADGAVFAPLWKVGDGWTYQVSGAWAGEGFTATYGVVEDNGDHWGMAADQEAAFALAFGLDGFNMFLDGVEKETMGVMQHDAFQDLVGFARPTGATWEASLFDARFEMTKVSVEGGEVVVEGSAGDRALSVVYADAERNLRTFAIADGAGTDLLRFELQATTDAAGGLFRWVVSDDKRMVADLGFETATATTWDSDGAGTLLYITAAASSSDAVAAGRITDPGGQEVMLFTSTPGQASRAALQADDQAGQWVLGGVSGGPHLLFVIRQVQVATF